MNSAKPASTGHEMLTAEPKALGSSWYNATRVESPARARLSVELDVDVCVIGAGLAGLTVAREIARRGWSVIVLESQSVAWDASGRNAGIVRPGFALDARALVERVGLDQTRELWALSVAGAEYVRNAAREMPGAALTENGWLEVATTDNTRAMAAEAALLVGEFGTLVEPWSAERVRDALRTERYFHGLHHPHGFSVHPLNYALGLAASAEAAGARIFEDTRVLEIDPAGVRKRIVTSGSRVRANHVVLAGNIHLADLLPEFASTLVPLFGTVITTAPLGQALRETIRYPGAVGVAGSAGEQYRAIEGSRLLWAGRSAVSRINPQRAGRALARRIRQFYPALADIKVEYAWSGTIGDTVHGMPQIGEVSPGLWLVSGFGNHGLNTTAMGGELVARAIVDGDRTWELFSSFAMVWAGGRLGRAAKQMFSWSARVGARVEASSARRREVQRLKAEARAAKVKQFAGLAAAAAAAPAAEMPAVHPSIERLSEPAEAMAEPAPIAAPEVAPEPPEPAYPDGAVVVEPRRFVEPAPAPRVEPAPQVEPEPQAEPSAVSPPPRKPKRGPKKKKASKKPTTLAELSREMIENAPAPVQDEQGEASETAPQPPASVDKKI